LGTLVLALAGLAAWILARGIRVSPEKKERLRRLAVNREGRGISAVITDADDTCFYYTYAVRGVAYAVSQDYTTLRNLLPAEPGKLVGEAVVRYSPRNPANSIVLCEDWSGLRGNGAPTSPRSSRALVSASRPE
jgi:hypothetical protein